MNSNTQKSPNRLVLVLSVAVITFLCYNYTLHNHFTNWDDNIYVKDNPYIKNLSADNFKTVLFHNITNNYYHPVTILSIAANYAISEMQPFGYYFTNVGMHVLNTMLMFFLVLMLLEAMEENGYSKIQGKEWLAALGALLYGIHPMHVESVAWLAERKDVMYCFFYFLGMITYLKYIRAQKVKWIIYTVVLFLLSLLSKPLAVVFPLSLFAIDILLRRKVTLKTVLEKSPMLLVSLAAGIWAFKAQVSSGAVNAFHSMTIMQRLLVASYGFVMYIVKAVAPVDLSAYYPYPSGNLPGMFYAMPVIAFLIVGLPLYLSYRKNRSYFRVLLFGFLFYFVNVMFVLQFVSSGATIMADRYTYIAYFGLFFMLVYFVQQLWEKKTSAHKAIQVVVAVFVVMLGYLCYNRTKVWHDTETLMTDIIHKYPDEVNMAYINLAAYYADKGEIDKAYDSYRVLAEKRIATPIIYNNLANIYSGRRQFDSALIEYSQSISLDSNDFHVYVDRGMAYARQRQYDKAIEDYNHAFRLDTMAEKLVANRALAYFMTKQYANALTDYSRAIRINPDNSDYFFNRGVVEMDMGDLNNALSDFKHTLEMNPRNGDCAFDLSLLYNKMGDYLNALTYANQAEAMGYRVGSEYINGLRDKVISPQK